MNATQELHSHKHILTTTLGLPTVSLRRAFMGWDVMVVRDYFLRIRNQEKSV